MEWERLRRREMEEGEKCKGKAERVEKNENQERTADSARGGAGQGVSVGQVRAPGCAHLGCGWWRRSEPRPSCPPHPGPLSCGWNSLPWTGSAPCRPWRVGLQSSLSVAPSIAPEAARGEGEGPLSMHEGNGSPKTGQQGPGET